MVNKKNEVINPKLLQLFELLYTTGSVTRSADQLELSQPTVSIWLAKLREQFNDPLFVRTSKGMQPTPRADSLINAVKSALESFQVLSKPIPEFDPSTAKRSFRICMTDASHVTLLPTLLSHVRAVAPNIKLEAVKIDENMSDALQSGEADLAIGLLPQLEAGFYQQVLFDQDWICLANQLHPRIDKKITRDQYKKEEHILIASGTGHNLLNQALKDQNVQRNVQLELPGFLGLPAILSTTDLIVTLPRHIGETLAKTYKLQVLKCPYLIPGFSVKQYWHARYQHDSANRWLRNLSKSILGK